MSVLVELRRLLSEPPSRLGWERVCAVIDAYQGPELGVALDYVEAHLKAQAPSLPFLQEPHERTGFGDAPRAWRDAVVRGEHAPQQRLIRALNLGAYKPAEVSIDGLTANPNLRNLGWLNVAARHGVPLPLLKALVGSSSLPALTHLYLSGMELNPQAAWVLVEDGERGLGRLTHLAMMSGGRSVEGWTQLADASFLGRLEVLVTGARQRAPGFQAFVSAPWMTRLRALQLNYPYTSEIVAGVLGGAYHSTLRVLDLGGCSLEGEGAMLAQLRALERLERLALNRTGLTDLDASMILSGSAWPSLEAIELSGNPRLGNVTGYAIAEAELPRLRCVMCNGASISAKAAVRWLKRPWASQLTTLALQSNPLGDAFALALASATHIDGLEQLDLYNTGMTADGLRALARSPHLGSLKRLGIANNDIHPKAGRAIVNASPYWTDEVKQGVAFLVGA